ncbi:YceI family protein [Aestuariivita boseongensis]|uniref:YceI family protein n=1 Tax=Aestuariivita boseongensis TaxID=1470562 RepID=UPI000682E0BC|nr:YceI family protein [Aestuariivita boseongensis]
MLTRRALLVSLAALATPARARPTPYVLDPGASHVGFSFRLMGGLQRGDMPVTRADLVVDPADLAASTADVIVNPARARTGFFFVTDTLKSPAVLDTARFPDIRFTSTAVRLAPTGRLSDGAALIGNLTVRDVTRPVTLDAALFRPPGTAPDDLSVLTITLNGQISRAAFGATGYPEAVDDTIWLEITATIRATG